MNENIDAAKFCNLCGTAFEQFTVNSSLKMQSGFIQTFRSRWSLVWIVLGGLIFVALLELVSYLFGELSQFVNLLMSSTFMYGLMLMWILWIRHRNGLSLNVLFGKFAKVKTVRIHYLVLVVITGMGFSISCTYMGIYLISQIFGEISLIEALFDGALTDQSADNAPRAHTDVATDSANPFDGTWITSGGVATATGEAMGDGTQPLNAMAFTIAKTTVTATTRALKAEYSTELAQDLKAVHGLDAETELANILSTEILAEINREVIRTIYDIAYPGAVAGTVSTAGTFNLDVDSNGRWMVEKFKGLLFHIEREANAISVSTRRGKGNFILCSNDIASALAMAGILDYAPAMDASVNNDTHVSTMVGTVNGMKVFVDPYYMVGAMAEHMLTVGYKGTSSYDAGLFYCPYVPLQMVRAMGEQTFQPKIAFKTRYGMSVNPFVNNLNNGAYRTSNIVADVNTYYRKVKVINLM